MQANEYTPTKVTGQRAQQVASWKHFLGFLLICAVIVVLGFVAQHAPAGSGASGSHSQLGSHNQAIHVYLAAILMDWILLYYCWAGVHRRADPELND